MAPITTPSDAALVRALSLDLRHAASRRLLNSLRGYSLGSVRRSCKPAGRRSLLVRLSALRPQNTAGQLLQKRRRTQATALATSSQLASIHRHRSAVRMALHARRLYSPGHHRRRRLLRTASPASHIHDSCSAALTAYYLNALPRNADVLDLCSSWTSHLPPSEALPLGRVAGLGMNEESKQMHRSLSGA